MPVSVSTSYILIGQSCRAVMQAQFLQMSTADQEDYKYKNNYICYHIFRRSKRNSP